MRAAIVRLAGAQSPLRLLLCLFRHVLPGHRDWLGDQREHRVWNRRHWPTTTRVLQAGVAVVQRPGCRPLAVNEQGSGGGAKWPTTACFPRQVLGPGHLWYFNFFQNQPHHFSGRAGQRKGCLPAVLLRTRSLNLKQAPSSSPDPCIFGK